jgi:FkbM family methyltransferase
MKNQARRLASAVARRMRRQAPPRNLSEVFEVVYGRPPQDHELHTISEQIPPGAGRDVARLFRAVINGVDHHHHHTPFSVRFGADDVLYTPFEGLEIAVDSADISVSAPIIQGHYEGHLRPVLADLLSEGDTFVDVGANVGLYSLLASRIVGPEGSVHAFEPNSENCRLILLSSRHNAMENITLWPVALGADPGHSLFTTALGSNGSLVTETEDRLLHTTAVVVPIVRLDDTIDEKINLMKIDVEGAESLVIKGASALVEKHRPAVITEFSLEMLSRVSGDNGLDYLQYWERLGYELHLCERESGALTKIESAREFVDGYGSPMRIEDLVLRPR